MYAEGSEEVPQDYEAAMEHFQKAKDMVGTLLLLLLGMSCDVSCDLPGRVMLTGAVGWECSTTLEWEWSR